MKLAATVCTAHADLLKHSCGELKQLCPVEFGLARKKELLLAPDNRSGCRDRL